MLDRFREWLGNEPCHEFATSYDQFTVPGNKSFFQISREKVQYCPKVTQVKCANFVLVPVTFDESSLVSSHELSRRIEKIREHKVIETQVEVWENERCCGNKSRRQVFLQLFRVLPIFNGCFYLTIRLWAQDFYDGLINYCLIVCLINYRLIEIESE